MMSIPQNINFILVSADYPMDQLFEKFIKFKPNAINAFLPKMVEFVNTNAFKSSKEDISFVKFVMGRVQKKISYFLRHLSPRCIKCCSIFRVRSNLIKLWAQDWHQNFTIKSSHHLVAIDRKKTFYFFKSKETQLWTWKIFRVWQSYRVKIFSSSRNFRVTKFFRVKKQG